MSYDDPGMRHAMILEGVRRWLPGDRSGYRSLAEAMAADRRRAPMVVNNCAAAVMLAVAAIAADRETVVSRGQLIEIGGGFGSLRPSPGADPPGGGRHNESHPVVGLRGGDRRDEPAPSCGLIRRTFARSGLSRRSRSRRSARSVPR